MTRKKQYKQELVDELKQKIKGKMRYADILLSVETVEMIIKALEQEPKQEDYSTEILSSEEIIGLMKALQEKEPKTNAFNKIKTEIQNLTVVYPFVNHIDQYVKKDDVIKIIDKYRQDG